jgi:hypothetical protein
MVDSLQARRKRAVKQKPHSNVDAPSNVRLDQLRRARNPRKENLARNLS